MGQALHRCDFLALSSRTGRSIVRDFAVMKSRGVFGMLCCLIALGAAGHSRARADQAQFVLIDATFTATANNTMSSEYAVAPLPGAPANWRAPVDFAAGTLHVRVEVLEKPSDRETLCNVCFKAADVLTCQPYPKPYTKPGVYKSEAYFSSFWQYEMYDWTKPVERVNVVVKDENGRFVQGNPAFFPTKLHVTVTIVPPGERLMESDPLGGDDMDGGVIGTLPDEPAAPTGMVSNASTAGAAGIVASSAPGSAGTAAAPVTAAGASAAGHSAPLTALNTERSINDYIDKGSSCAVLHARPKARYGAVVSLVIAAFSLWQSARIARSGRRTRRHVRGVRSHGRRA